MFTALILTPLIFLAPTQTSAPLAVGDQAPPFTAADSDGKMIELATVLKRGPVVLAFYPKAQTSGCTQEMKALVSGASMLARFNAQVLAVSRDDAATLQTFKKELAATFTFVSDRQGALMRAYQCKMPVVTVAKRKTFVINQAGAIVHTAEGQDAIALKGIEQALAALAPKQPQL